jgi:hypothetical protein
LLPWAFKLLCLQSSLPMSSFQLANCINCEPKTCPIQGRGSIALEIKPGWTPCWVCLLFVSGSPFYRSKFCLACWLLSCVLSPAWHPNILKRFLTTWGLIQDFHITRKAMETPSSGETHPATMLQWPQGWGNPPSQQWTPDQKSVGNTGKEANPSKQHRGPG